MGGVGVASGMGMRTRWRWRWGVQAEPGAGAQWAQARARALLYCTALASGMLHSRRVRCGAGSGPWPAGAARHGRPCPHRPTTMYTPHHHIPPHTRMDGCTWRTPMTTMYLPVVRPRPPPPHPAPSLRTHPLPRTPAAARGSPPACACGSPPSCPRTPCGRRG